MMAFRPALSPEFAVMVSPPAPLLSSNVMVPPVALLSLL